MQAVVSGQEVDASIERIERDHHSLGTLLERMRVAVTTGDTDRAQALFLQLQVSEEEHFAAEERAMRRFAYPSFEHHKSVHDSLRGSMLSIGRVLLAERPRNIHDSVVDYIAQTLSHIEQVDRPLQEFLREQAQEDGS